MKLLHPLLILFLALATEASTRYIVKTLPCLRRRDWSRSSSSSSSTTDSDSDSREYGRRRHQYRNYRQRMVPLDNYEPAPSAYNKGKAASGSSY